MQRGIAAEEGLIGIVMQALPIHCLNIQEQLVIITDVNACMNRYYAPLVQLIHHVHTSANQLRSCIL